MLDVFIYVSVVNSENAIAQLLEVSGARRIGAQLSFDSMSATIHLHNKLALTTCEVDEIWANRLLAYELEPAELTIAKMTPEDAFCRNLFRAKNARAVRDPRLAATHGAFRLVAAPHPDPLPMPKKAWGEGENAGVT
jgi:hypothetical protein